MDQAECLHLIELYRQNRLLWDARHKGYFKKDRRDLAWREMSVTMGESVNKLKTKMRTLMGSYRSEKSRERKKKLTGAVGEDYEPKWFAFKSFEFLSDKDYPEPNQYTKSKTKELREESNMQNSSLAATAIEQRVELTDDNVPTERSSKCRPKNNEAKQKISEKNLDPKLINEALHILQSSANYSKDPFFTYALNLANELRKYDPQTLAHVKRGISNIIFDADIGEFSGSNASSRMPTISLECMAQTDNSTDPLQYSPPQETSTTNFKIETTDNELS
ncbi:uncharacterized protein LOC114324639 [Diabrotica virgifera virgifera]|uniref:Uncharacterized protein LOC114324639 n=1 Tax=Diabrotica virgifera virgifera TaxID=50390 RepID=A0A6P7F372_DIAVI|nr:uncharacterized protein LOC114324639 [Diabrotica virgifera virgifera]